MRTDGRDEAIISRFRNFVHAPKKEKKVTSDSYTARNSAFIFT